MRQTDRIERQNASWLAAAVAAPLLQTATGCSWPAVLLIGGVCALLCWAITREPCIPSRWLNALRSLWACVVAAELLHWSAYCWPSHEHSWAAPLILLLLAVWTVAGVRERAARAGCVLLWPVAMLLGAVLLSGAAQVRLEHLEPVWCLPDAGLVTALLIPALAARRGNTKLRGATLNGLLLLGVAASAIGSGVLSLAAAKRAQSPIYELSRSLSLFGVAERFESVVAAALTLGYFASLTYLLDTGGEETERWSAVGTGVLTAILYLSGARLDGRWLAVGSVFFWVVLPVMWNLKNNLKKYKKGIDKKRKAC